jgi:DNA-binding FrmR family transcriptional regulator
MSLHSSHPEIVKRLKRAAGHLQGVIDMLEHERGCVEVAQQLQAVESAIAKAKKTLVHDHIDHCLQHALQKGARAGKDSIEEFKEITKYL